MTIGRVLFDNVYRDPANTGFAYSGTEVSGFPKENATDWRDFSLFRLETSFKNLDITMFADTEIDCLGWYTPPPGNNIVSMFLEYESAPATFTPLVDMQTNLDGLLGLKTFTPVTVAAGRIVRVRMRSTAAARDIRQVTVGKIFTFPIGQHQGIAPPNLPGGFVTSNNISVNGSFIGRDRVRADVQGNISLEFLSPTFVRDEWSPFITHCERFPFYYAWDLDTFPDEVAFAWTKGTPPRPTNTGPGNKMDAELAWSALVQ